MHVSRLAYTLFFFLVAFFVCALPAHAATMSAVPRSNTATVGGDIVVDVYIDSSVPVNAVSGVVAFPTGSIDVTSLSKVGSSVSLWPVEPSFSDALGTVSFEGVMLGEGVSGRHKIISFAARAKHESAALFSVVSGSILAHDGLGTNVLDGMVSGTVSIGPSTVFVPLSGNHTTITSSTHPDQTTWSDKSSAHFVWTLPSDALEVRTILSTSPSAQPAVSYIPAISERTVEDVADGTHYFAVQVRTAAGWGAISRYRINIDTQAPAPFEIKFPHGEETFEPQPVALFNTDDDESGIDRYEVRIDDGGPSKVAPPTGSNPYVIPPQKPGTYRIAVAAYDKAGNVRNATAMFTIEGIEAPKITYYQEDLQSGDIPKIRGNTYQHSDVYLIMRNEAGEVIAEEYTRSNGGGDFAIVMSKRLDPGTYTFTAWVVDGRGAHSVETDPITITVHSTFISRILDLIAKHSIVASIVITISIILLLSPLYLWYQVALLNHTVARMTAHTRQLPSAAPDIKKYITRIKRAGSRRPLTPEEQALLDQFDS